MSNVSKIFQITKRNATTERAVIPHQIDLGDISGTNYPTPAAALRQEQTGDARTEQR